MTTDTLIPPVTIKAIQIRHGDCRDVIRDLIVEIKYIELMRQGTRSANRRWVMTLDAGLKRGLLRRAWTAYRATQTFLHRRKS